MAKKKEFVVDPNLSNGRYPSDSIDFDFYRKQTTALRGQAARDSAALKSACIGLCLILVVFPFFVAMMTASIRMPNSRPFVAQTNMPAPLLANGTVLPEPY